MLILWNPPGQSKAGELYVLLASFENDAGLPVGTAQRHIGIDEGFLAGRRQGVLVRVRPCAVLPLDTVENPVT